jgi:hypothetical protein
MIVGTPPVLDVLCEWEKFAEPGDEAHPTVAEPLVCLCDQFCVTLAVPSHWMGWHFVLDTRTKKE